MIGDLSRVRHYCTLFDANYLPRAVALYRSLERCEEEFLLHAVCMDAESHELMAALALPQVRLIAIAELEEADPELREVRPTRSPGEYCWTATPAVCRFVLDRIPGDEVLTYLDADLCFSSSPAPLFAELGGGSTMVVPHRSSDELTATFGIYNVGWVSFRNDGNGRAAVTWWRERCLEWCYDISEPDRFGDQKYLDDWPERFAGVRVCTSPGAGLAPWNDGAHQLVSGRHGVLVDGTPLIFYHHSGLRVHRAEAPSARLASLAPRYHVNAAPVRFVWTLVSRPPAAVVHELVWTPYVTRLADAHREVAAAGGRPTVGMRPTVVPANLTEVLRSPVLGPVLRATHRLPPAFRRRVASVLARRWAPVRTAGSRSSPHERHRRG